jgi:hypothetical protein
VWNASHFLGWKLWIVDKVLVHRSTTVIYILCQGRWLLAVYQSYRTVHFTYYRLGFTFVASHPVIPSNKTATWRCERCDRIRCKGCSQFLFQNNPLVLVGFYQNLHNHASDANAQKIWFLIAGGGRPGGWRPLCTVWRLVAWQMELEPTHDFTGVNNFKKSAKLSFSSQITWHTVINTSTWLVLIKNNNCAFRSN